MRWFWRYPAFCRSLICLCSLVIVSGYDSLPAAEPAETVIPAEPKPITPAQIAPAVAADPLPKHAVAWLGSRRFKVGDSGNVLAFTPDGRELVCLGFWHKLFWLDARTGQVRRSLADTATLLQPRDVVVAARAGWVAYRPADVKVLFNICDLSSAKPLKSVAVAPPTERSNEDATLAQLSADPRLILSPDECWLAVCDSAATQVFDTRTWNRTAVLPADRVALPGACFSADSKLLVLVRMKDFPDGGRSSVLSFYTTDGFKLLHESDQASHIDAGPYATPQALITGEKSTIIRQWDWQTGKETKNIERTEGAGIFSEIHADSRWPDIVTSVASEVNAPPIGLMLLTAKNLEFHFACQLKDEAMVQFACAPDQKRIALATDHGRVGVFDGETGRLQYRFEVGGKYFPRLVFSADGVQLAVQDQWSTVSVWNLQVGSGITAPVAGHRDGVSALQFSPDGGELLSWSPYEDQNLIRWNMATHAENSRLHASPLMPIFANGKSLSGLLGVNKDHKIELLGMAGKPRPLGDLGMPKGRMFAPPAFNASMHGLVWWEASAQRLVVADAVTGKMRCAIPGIDDLSGQPYFASNVERADDADSLLIAANGDWIHGWDSATGAERFKLTVLPQSRPVAVSARGRYLATANNKGELAVWDLSRNRLIMPWRRTNVSGFDRNICFFSDNEKWLVYTTPKNGMQSFHLDHEKTTATWTLDDSLWSFAFVPGGQQVITGDFAGTVRVWDVASGKCQKTIQHTQAGYVQVAVSADGKWLATGSRDCTILLWDLPALLAARE